MSPSPSGPSIPPDAPRVLLFGHSGAGKSALLGALYQAGEKQGDILLGEVLDSTGRLSSLRDAVYRGPDLNRTHAELNSYLVRLRPWRSEGLPLSQPGSVLLYDCSGRAAEGLIHHPAALHDPKSKAPIARAVIEADAVLLLVNASTDDRDLHAAFQEFEAFLHVVGLGKETAREVGGFPVFLVLTQCDRLAQPEDTWVKWVARVEARAERAWAQFDAFLRHAVPEDEDHAPFLPFGSLALSVYAVAIRQPRLQDVPGQPALPFRVAELFRDCFAAASAHRRRVRASDTRLWWILRFAIMFVAVLVLAMVGVSLCGPWAFNSQLATRIRTYEEEEPAAGVRLAEPERSRDKRILTAFQDDPDFGTLPGSLRDFVDNRLKEIHDYEQYAARLDATTRPAQCRSLEELDRVEQTLRVDLAFPDHYEWSDTPAAALRDKFLADVGAIRHMEGEFQTFYRDRIRRAIALTLAPSFGGSWRADANGLLTGPVRLPVAASVIMPQAMQRDLWRDFNFEPFLALNAPLPGSPEVQGHGGRPVDYRVPYEFERVYQSRKEWQAAKERLTHLRDLADALGLTAGANLPAALLVLPEPSPGVNPATLAAARWTALVRTYPEAGDDFKEWTLSNFPDPGRKRLAEALERSFHTGASYVRGLIRERPAREGQPLDTPASWRALAGVLTDSTTPFPEWGKLLHLYLRLRDPDAPNPIVELAAFLRRPSFDLKFHEATLAVPLDLSLGKVYPAGPLTVTVEKDHTIRLKAEGEGVREGSNTIYRLTAEGADKLSFAPGDALRAEMPVRSGMQELKLVWEKTSSRSYPFDLFQHDTRLEKADGTSEPALGVKLKLSAGDEWPRLPVLFPETR